MKIALVCRVYATHGRQGGMIHVCQERAEELARQGHQVHVFTTHAGVLPPPNGMVNGVAVQHCLSGEPQHYSDEYATFCAKACHDLCPDILHLDSYDCNRLWWHDRPGKPKAIMVSNHGEGIGSQLTDWRLALHGRDPAAADGEARMGLGNKLDTSVWMKERAALEPADAIIATCRFDRWMLSDLLKLRQVHLVYNPLAPWHWDNRDLLPPTTKRFLVVGLWGNHERGFDLATEACRKVGAELLQPRNVERKVLAHWYDRAKALLLPTFQSKGFDLSVAESIARLRPVICSDNGINSFEAIDKPWMVLVPPGDVGALAEALEKPLPAVPPWAADPWRPDRHVQGWIEAIG